jgi:hypothetical protein
LDGRKVNFNELLVDFRHRCELLLLGILGGLGAWRKKEGHALVYCNRLYLLVRVIVLGSRLDAHLDEIFRWILVSFSNFSQLLLRVKLTSFDSFSISGIAANTYAYLGEFHAEKNRARYLSFAGVFMAFALTFCPGVGWLILKFQHSITSISIVIPVIELNYSIWRIFLLLCSLLSGFVSLLLFFLPESPKFLLAQERHDEALKILASIYRRNRGNESAYPVDKIFLDEFVVKRQTERPTFFKQVWLQTSPLFKTPLLSNTLKTSFVMFSLFAASSGFFMWTPDILNKLLEYRDQNYTVCHVIDEVIKLRNE